MSKKDESKTIHKNNYEIDFDEETHSYYVNGVRLPSVSEIMSPLSKEYYKNIDKETMKKAAQRGKTIHKNIEFYEEFGVMNDDYKDYLFQYQIAKKLEKINVLKCEVMMTDGTYCGTFDLLVEIDNELVLIDTKATSKINKELLQVQLAAYLKLARHNGYNVFKSKVLHLKKDGYKLKDIEPNYTLWEDMKMRYYEKV